MEHLHCIVDDDNAYKVVAGCSRIYANVAGYMEDGAVVARGVPPFRVAALVTAAASARSSAVLTATQSLQLPAAPT